VITQVSTADSDGSTGAADAITTSGGTNTILGGTGGDTINAPGGTNIILGDNGTVVTGGNITSTDPAIGGNDTITGGASDNTILGGAGSDTISAPGGTNTILGDNGTVARTAGVITQVSTADSDGSTGAADAITASGGTNTILGGTGGDTIAASGGTNIILGDNGEVVPGSLIRTLDPSVGGSDRISAALGSTNTILGGAADDIIDAPGGTNIILGDSGSVTVGGDITTTDPGIGGNDTISGGLGDNTILGGAGSDTIMVAAGTNTILGDNGRIARTAGNVILTVESIDPTIGGADAIFGGVGADTIFGGTGQDKIEGGAGEDVIMGDHGIYDRTLPAGRSAVTSLFSGPQEGGDVDTIFGDAGNDVIFGQFGNDILTGGEGDDTFVFEDGCGRDAVFEAEYAGYDSLDFTAVTTRLIVMFNYGSVMVGGPDNGAAHDKENVERVVLREGIFTRPVVSATGVGQRGAPVAGAPTGGVPVSLEAPKAVTPPVRIVELPPAEIVAPGRNYFDTTSFEREWIQLQQGDGEAEASGATSGTGSVITSLTTGAFRVGAAQENQAITLTGLLENLTTASIREATVSWGDGTVERVALTEGSGGLTVAGQHAFATGGIYDVTLSAATTDGAVVTRTTKVRVTGAGINDRVLQIVGTAGDDAVRVTSNGDLIEVRGDFLPGGGLRTFRAEDFDIIVILTGAGANRIDIDERIAKSVVTEGGIRADLQESGEIRQGAPRAGALAEGRRALRQGGRMQKAVAEAEKTAADFNKTATVGPAVDWTGSYARTYGAGNGSAPGQESSPGLVDFEIAEAVGGESDQELPQVRLPLTVLALDVLGKFIGPQLGNGAPQKKNGKNGKNGTSEQAV
jgi:Ca2+-binding RTX toxin-like protein